ncbi:C-type lectin 37Db-like [Drosophila obscura]|uniref:C-type lectin 37Db-like n=1 Tax=Drosophila obscura TaxID=7282 RepID=UPI001BB12BBC|nr:C-type lectin 37Db-like [Drosophila obscura]
MSKSASLLLCMLIVLYLQKYVTSDSNTALLTQNSESQCGGYCISAIKLFLEHIAANQQRWNAFDVTTLECKAILDRKVPKVKQKEYFVQIGSRFFYIEQHHRVNWFSATSICRQMGGYLASPRSEDELNGIKEKLTRDRYYWLGISDLGNEGLFLSVATGKMASFLKWSSGEPNNRGKNERCVELRSDFLMNNNACTFKTYFICEASGES